MLRRNLSYFFLLFFCSFICGCNSSEETHPNKDQIARVATRFFSKQQSCLDTLLLDKETKDYIKGQRLSLEEIQKKIESGEMKALLQEVKRRSKEQVAPFILDYSKKLPIHKGSLIVYPERKYLLTRHPKTEKDIKWFWKSMIDFNSNKAVAAIMPDEKIEKSAHDLDYCQEKHYPLAIDSEWKIELLETKSLAKSKLNANCEIIKRSFRAFSKAEERIIHHYHYQGWKNRRGAPDPFLLAILLRELGENHPSDDVVTIHCAAGRGRSSNVVLADIFKKRLQQDPKGLNIAEIIMQGRLMRDGFVETPEQIASALECALITDF